MTEDKVEATKQLIKLQEIYIRFLDRAYNEVFSIAHIHGYTTSKEDIEIGVNYRKQISQLQEKINHQ